MSAIAKSMSLSTFNRSNVVVMLCVLGAVLALFFLPEIVDLQRTVSSSGAAKKAAPVTVDSSVAAESGVVESPVSLRSVSAPSPLEEVLQLLDERSDPRARADLKPIMERAQAAESNESSGDAPNRSAETSDAIQVLSQSPLTWNAIQSEASRKALRNARSDALDLAQTLGKRNRSTRYALFNFASGLGLALDPKAQRLMKPEELVTYLERLDFAVSRSMSRESVDRSDYLAWANISLGPVFEATRLGHRDVNFNVPFNPQLTLTSAWVMHRRPDALKRGQKERVYVIVSGFVRGKDAKKIRLVDENGSTVRTIKLRRVDAETDYRFFQTPKLNGREDWTIVVDGTGDDTYSKTYRFYSRAARYQWGRLDDLPVSGYRLPFRNVPARPAEFNPKAVDPRLDSFFQVGGSDSSSNLIFSSF